MNRAVNALPVPIIYQSILQRMYTIRRPAEMRVGGDESSTIDNDIRQTIRETNCHMNGIKDEPIHRVNLAVSKDKQINAQQIS